MTVFGRSVAIAPLLGFVSLLAWIAGSASSALVIVGLAIAVAKEPLRASAAVVALAYAGCVVAVWLTGDVVGAVLVGLVGVVDIRAPSEDARMEQLIWLVVVVAFKALLFAFGAAAVGASQAAFEAEAAVRSRLEGIAGPVLLTWMASGALAGVYALSGHETMDPRLHLEGWAGAWLFWLETVGKGMFFGFQWLVGIAAALWVFDQVSPMGVADILLWLRIPERWMLPP